MCNMENIDVAYRYLSLALWIMRSLHMLLLTLDIRADEIIPMVIWDINLTLQL